MGASAKQKKAEKLRKRRARKAQQKREQKERELTAASNKVEKKDDEDVKFVYVNSEIDTSGLDPELVAAMSRFANADQLLYGKGLDAGGDSQLPVSSGDGHTTGDGGDSRDADHVLRRKLTKKQRKEEKRLRVAVLKQMVDHPDLIDMYDVSSPFPLMLAHLKGVRNTVPVPIHWKRKRKYLQGKRGKEKIPFELPEYIAKTGIASMRAAQLERDAEKKAKQKGRERMQPKMHRLDIDYKVLRDAFFKYQTKPKVTGHGDLYYEGKEFEVDIKSKRPGYVSPALRQALGMHEGMPPPWLLNQQRWGPPPSYPQLRIPGVNAPLPPGAEYGFHPGQWGRPPVDEYNRPLYGDVYGVPSSRDSEMLAVLGLDQAHTQWGKLQQELVTMEMEESESSSSEEEEEVEEEDVEEAADRPPKFDAVQAAIAAPSEAIQLRKGGGEKRQLAQVLKEQSATVGDSLYGSSFSYVIPGQEGPASGVSMKSQKTAESVITLDSMDLEDLEGGQGARVLRDKFEAAQEAQEGAAHPRVDLSDVHAEHRAPKKKRKKSKKDDYKF